jgi:hypothetical protein
MTAILDALTPALAQIAGLGALLVVVAGFGALGAWVTGRRRIAEADPVYGWALIIALFTGVGVLRVVPFTVIAVAALALAVAAVAGLAVRRRAPVTPALLRITVLTLPLVLTVAAMQPSQWDEFANWLPNARYLVEIDGFPGLGLPPDPSSYPAYPYGLPLVIYLVSRIAGHLVENAAALFNLFLLLVLGLLAVRLAREALGRTAADDGHEGWTWGWCALGALAAIALNPTFVTKIAFTAYADTATAVTLALAAALGWRALNALADDRADDARANAWQMGLAATALLGLKQVNLVLLAALVATLVLVTLRDPALRLRSLARLAIPALALPLALYLAWRYYVVLNIPQGEFPFRPVSDWSWALIPDVMGRMARIASKKGGYFGLMIVATVFALKALWRPRSPFDRLAVIAGGIFVAYNGFLLFIYIAAFAPHQALGALSYWRYNMHLGGVGVVFAAYGGALLWRRHVAPRWRPRLGWLAVTVVLVAPVTLATKIRFDLNPRYLYARSTAESIAQVLNPSDRLVLVDLEDDGQYLVIMHYALHGSATPLLQITAYSGADANELRATIERAHPSHLWLYRPVPAIEAALDVRLAPGSSYLLRRDDGGWTSVQAWPHPARRR